MACQLQQPGLLSGSKGMKSLARYAEKNHNPRSFLSQSESARPLLQNRHPNICFPGDAHSEPLAVEVLEIDAPSSFGGQIGCKVMPSAGRPFTDCRDGLLSPAVQLCLTRALVQIDKKRLQYAASEISSLAGRRTVRDRRGRAAQLARANPTKSRHGAFHVGGAPSPLA